MSDTNYYEHVKDCLEGARNRRFCAGAENGAAEIKRLRDLHLARTKLTKQMIDERDEARDALEQANARERKAFAAGLMAAVEQIAGEIEKATDIDPEQMWQQYRCQDDTDFRAARGCLADPESAGDTLLDDGEGQAAALSEIDR